LQLNNQNTNVCLFSQNTIHSVVNNVNLLNQKNVEIAGTVKKLLHWPDYVHIFMKIREAKFLLTQVKAILQQMLY